MEKNTKTAIWVTVAVATIITGVVTVLRHPTTKVSPAVKTISSQTEITPPTEVATSTANTVATTTPTNIRRPKPALPTPLNYGETVNKYMNQRLQFNDDCQGIPGKVFFANGTTVMLDNRANVKRKFSVAGKTYNVAAYGYTLVTLKQKTLPAPLRVDCDSHMNAVELTLE